MVHTPRRGELRCRYVVHTVGPIWPMSSDTSRCVLLLQRTFENVFDYSHRLLHATSIAVPAIGTGSYLLPFLPCYQAMSGSRIVNNTHDVTHWSNYGIGEWGDRPHGQKVVGAMPPNRPHRNFVMLLLCTLHSQNFLDTPYYLRNG